MSKTKLAAALALAMIVQDAEAQTAPPPSVASTPQAVAKTSQQLAATLEKFGAASPVSAQMAARAYAKLLEGERYLWAAKNVRGRRSQAVTQANIRAARLAFIQAIEANPRLAEAYTALSELSITAPPSDVDEAIDLAYLALRIDPKNFGALRLLARLHTYKSGFSTRSLDSDQAGKAVEAWKQVAVLDPRNAEAWAFLAEFYERQQKPSDQIQALERWRSSAAAVDSQFYQRMTGGRENLSPETASLKLGEVLLKSGKVQEAIDMLSLIVADEPENEGAVDLLREAVAASKGEGVARALEALRRAAFANPGNSALVTLLAEVLSRGGQVDEATRLLLAAAEKAGQSDKASAATYFVALAEINEKADKRDAAQSAYDKALNSLGAAGVDATQGDARELLVLIFERMIRNARNANRSGEIPAIIERSRKVLGPDDSFADRQLVTHYRAEGNRVKALEALRQQRTKAPREESLARLEATLLTEMGRVDDAVAGYRKHLTDISEAGVTGVSGSTANSTTATIQNVPRDNFSSQLFISQLYTQANRPKEAAEAANQALVSARGPERRQIARLSIASAQQMSGDHAGAEATLREILKESPGNPIALNNLGYFLLERNERFEEALKLIQQAVDVDPTNPSYLDSLGWAYFKLGKLTEAEKFLKEALRLDSTSSTINEHLGEVLEKQGKSDSARTHFQRAIDLASDNADIARIKSKLQRNTKR